MADPAAAATLPVQGEETTLAHESTMTQATEPTYTSLMPDEAGFARAGELLREGRLVAFPTETVYGLGANALDEKAVLDIFKCKGRPLTDPLIVHIADPKEADDLVELSDPGLGGLFSALSAKFWPGPLTLVAKSKPVLPLVLSAGTGFVGIRCPAHPIAVSMLKAAGVPVAAPSANRFGHVSPTLAAHVIKDLGSSRVGGGIAVINNDDSPAQSQTTEGDAAHGGASCGVGIESTVAKIDAETGEVVVFRRGGVSQEALQSVIDEGGFQFKIRCLSKKASEQEKGLQAPGQMLTHYAPDVTTFLVRNLDAELATATQSGPGNVVASATHVDDTGAALPKQAEAEAENAPDTAAAGMEALDLATCVVIDFNGVLAPLKQLGVLAYRDMSRTGDMKEAAHELFKSLRWSEQQPGAKRVLLADVVACQHEDTAAVRDRMYRAASGKQLTLKVAARE